ncbi:phosphonate ABC transporter ATP-binding protein [Alphaproteobacteria bacterium]|nr:phosphonate ABC transporter ATP-binding protein [Alphaproteobacteria bacterium]
MLRFDNIKKVFPDGTIALNGVSASINSGEFVALLGPSGSGKTTLLRSINGLNIPDSGSLYFEDQKITEENRSYIRQNLGVVFQDFNLIESLSSLNNVLTGLLFSSNKFLSLFYLFSKEQKLAALEMLSRVGVLDKAHTKVANLSGGQKQRVGIARAMVKKPALLIADEPVASLDPVMSLLIMNLLKNLSKDFNVTVVCSLHHVNLAIKFADRIIGLSDGVIILDQESDKTDPKMIEKIYQNNSAGLTFR